MKKLLIVIIVVGVIAAAAFYGLKTVTPTQEVDMAEILPNNVAFYYSIQNLDTIWDNVKDSSFWKEFSGLDLWENLQVSSGIEDLKTQFKDNIGIELSEDNFLKLAGRELAIAIIPAADANAAPKILVLFRGKNKKALDSIVGPIADNVKKADPGKIVTNQYSGKTISQIKSDSPDQPEIYFTVLDNVLALGIGDTLTAIQKTIDISSGKAADSLAKTSKYKNVQALIGQNKKLAAIFYMDFSTMKDFLQGLSLPGPTGSQTQLTPGMDTLDYIGGWTEISDGLITKLYIYPNKEGLTPEMKKMWEAKPAVPGTLKLVPENVLLYLVSNTIDVSSMWNLWQENLKEQAPDQTQPVLDGISDFEEEWNISIENDVLPLIGNEIAFIFSDISTQGFIPIPKLGLALKVKDKKKMDKIIEDLIATNNEKAAAAAAELEEATLTEAEATETETGIEVDAVTIEEDIAGPSLRFQLSLTDETYEGQPIKTLQLPLVGTGLAPGYTYIDDYLIIGATTKTLQEIIDVKDKKINSLSKDPVYAGLSDLIPSANNQESYINMGRLIDIGIGICNWVVTFQQMTIPQGPAPEDPAELEAYTAQKVQAEATITTINDTVVPVLKTLRSLKLIASASVNKKDHIEQTMILKIEDI